MNSGWENHKYSYDSSSPSSSTSNTDASAPSPHHPLSLAGSDRHEPIHSKANLSSRDFLTFGSQKDNRLKSSEHHDLGFHVRPGSRAGRNAMAPAAHAGYKIGTIDTWTRDGSPHFEDGVHPSANNWRHGDPRQNINPNIPLQYFDRRHGPPMNAPPTDIWYRGSPPAGPSYPCVPHGGYPIEPSSYYRPRTPPNLANSQWSQMHEPLIHQGMPVRPGYDPGPVRYNDYSGRLIGYNPNDRDMQFMGMRPVPHGPPVYTRGPPQNPAELHDPHFRSGGPGPAENIFTSKQLDSIPPEEYRGSYKVLRKHEIERDADIEGECFQIRQSFHKYSRGSDKCYQDFLNCNPRNFKGTEGAVGLIHWFENMESVFRISNCAENCKVKYATCTLQDNALTWWNSFSQSVGIDVAYQTPWDDVKQMMRDEYCRWNDLQKLEVEFLNLSVKGTDIAGYTNRFHELALLFPSMVTPEYKKIERYIYGLTPQIHGMVISSKPTSIQNAIRMAHDLMDQAVCRGTMVVTSDTMMKTSDGKRKLLITNPVAAGNCSVCGEAGHSKKKCPKKRSEKLLERTRECIVIKTEDSHQDPDIVTGTSGAIVEDNRKSSAS